MRRIYIAYVTVSAVILLGAAVLFSGISRSQADVAIEPAVAQNSVVRCFIGNKLDRPDPHMMRGWVCVAEREAPATN